MSTLEISIYMDGNAWCAIRTAERKYYPECNVGYGDTPQEALEVLLREEAEYEI